MMYKDIEKILENFNMIEKQAIDICSKTVQDIIVSKSVDKKLIEQIFDGMLGFCYDEDMLLNLIQSGTVIPAKVVQS